MLRVTRDRKQRKGTMTHVTGGWPVPFTPATLSLPPVHHLRAFSLHGWGEDRLQSPGDQGCLSGRLAARATSGLCTAHRHTGLSVGQNFWRFGI